MVLGVGLRRGEQVGLDCGEDVGLVRGDDTELHREKLSLIDDGPARFLVINDVEEGEELDGEMPRFGEREDGGVSRSDTDRC